MLSSGMFTLPIFHHRLPPTMRWRCAGNGRRYEEDEKRYVPPSLLQILLKQDYSNGEYVNCWYCCYFWLHMFGEFGRSILIFPDSYVSKVGGSISWWPHWSDRFVWCCPTVNSFVVGISFVCDVYLETCGMIQFWRNQVSWFQVDVLIVHRCGDDPILPNIDID